MLLKKYMEPLAAHANSKKPYISQNQVKMIFSITETLYNYHSMLLEGLERRITTWTPDTTLGDYFFSMADFLRVYPQYVNGYDSAVETLTNLEENPGFGELLRKLTNDPKHKGLNIFSYLIMPVQRIPRYILLLNDYGKKTPPHHVDTPGLKKSLQKVSEIADWVDEQKTLYDRGQQLVKLSENIQKTPSGWNLVVPGRILIKDGVLEHSGHDVNVWLFTDLLLLTRKVEQEKKKGKKSKKDEPDKFQYINKVELKNAQACEYPDNPTYKNAFSVAQGTHSILLQACSVDEMKEWIEDISKAVAAVKK